MKMLKPFVKVFYHLRVICFILLGTPTIILASQNTVETSPFINYQESIDEDKKIYTTQIEAGDKKSAMKTAHKIGNTYINFLLDFNKGLDYQTTALSIARELNNVHYEILTLQQIGYIHYAWNDVDNAFKYYREALAIAERIKDYQNVTIICTYLASFLEEQYRIKEALTCYKKILNNKHKIEQGPKALMAVGRYYKLIDKIDSTFIYYNNALAIFKDNKNYRWVSYVYSELANTSLSIGDNIQALNYANTGLEIAKQYRCKKEKYDNYLALSEIYQKNKNYKKSLECFRLYTEIKDSIYSFENKQNIEFLQLKLKLEEEEKEIAELKNEKKLNEIESTNKWYSNFAIIIGFILLFAILIIGYYRLMVIKKQNIEIEKSYQKELIHVKEKETLLKEVHHRVKNNMQIISSLLSLQQSTQTDEKSIELLEQSKYRIQAMAMIHEMLYQKENMGLINYEGYLNKLGNSLITALNVSNCAIELDINAPEIDLNIDTAVPLGLIINEILTNSLKYGFNGLASGKIYVHIENIGNKKLILKIGDNGNGFDYIKESNKANAIGLQLIETLSEQLNGKVKFLPIKGANFLISFEEA